MRVVKIEQTDNTGRIFGSPRMKDGSEMSLDTFASGQKMDMEDFIVPTIGAGPIPRASLVLDCIPIFDDIGAEVIKHLVGLEVQLVRSTSDDGQRLWIGNILSMLECIDRTRSKAEYYPANYPLKHLRNEVRFTSLLTLHEPKVRGVQIFRIKDDPLSVIVTASLLAQLSSCGMKSFRASTFPQYVVG